MTVTTAAPALIDLDEVLDLLDEVIEEVGPEYTHDECRYVNKSGTAPVCLIGVLAVEQSDIAPLSIMRDNFTRPTGVAVFNDRYTPNALLFLEEVQLQADLGFSWAESVERAKQHWGLV